MQGCYAGRGGMLEGWEVGRPTTAGRDRRLGSRVVALSPNCGAGFGLSAGLVGAWFPRPFFAHGGERQWSSPTQSKIRNPQSKIEGVTHVTPSGVLVGVLPKNTTAPFRTGGVSALARASRPQGFQTTLEVSCKSPQEPKMPNGSHRILRQGSMWFIIVKTVE